MALHAPCCGKEIEFEAVLGIAEWASNVPQWDIWQWNYYRCSHCQTPCWFGYNHEGGWFGIYGAAPVADLIPVTQIEGMPTPRIGPDSVTLEYLGVSYEIHRGEHYWKNA
ncbi:MAG: hypothetical protein ACTH3B_06190 [Pseudoalteromonas sp.]